MAEKRLSGIGEKISRRIPFMSVFYSVGLFARLNVVSVGMSVLIGECWLGSVEINSKLYASGTNYDRLTRQRETIQFNIVYL